MWPALAAYASVARSGDRPQQWFNVLGYKALVSNVVAESVQEAGRDANGPAAGQVDPHP
jgi:hypothetical protein